MKPILTLVALLFSGAIAVAAQTAEAGPRGGRLLASEPLQAEFFVTPERRLEITTLNAQGKPTSPGSMVFQVTAEPKPARTVVALEPTATGFVSKDVLPAGEPYRMVVQSRPAAGEKPKNFRVDLNLTQCAECGHAEYACTCEGH